MKHEDLPERWKNKIKEYVIAQNETDREELNAFDFSLEKIVKIKFEDGSYVEFNYPLVLESSEANEVGIFTEHCGYHIFSLTGATLTIDIKN